MCPHSFQYFICVFLYSIFLFFVYAPFFFQKKITNQKKTTPNQYILSCNSDRLDFAGTRKSVHLKKNTLLIFFFFLFAFTFTALFKDLISSDKKSESSFFNSASFFQYALSIFAYLANYLKLSTFHCYFFLCWLFFWHKKIYISSFCTNFFSLAFCLVKISGSHVTYTFLELLSLWLALFHAFFILKIKFSFWGRKIKDG